MSTAVPTDAAALLPETPVRGSAAEASAVGAYARGVRQDGERIAAALRTAVGALAAITSRGVTGIASRLEGTLAPGVELVSRTADAGVGALDRFGAEIERIHADAARTLAAVEAALAEIRTAAAEIAAVAERLGIAASYPWDVGAPARLPEPRLEAIGGGIGALAGAPGASIGELDPGQRDLAVQQLRALYEERWFRAACAWRSGVDAIGDARDRWRVLRDERCDAEIRLRDALHDTELGGLVEASGADVALTRLAIAAAVSGEHGGVRTDGGGLAALPALLAGELDPEQVARAWRRLEASGVDTERLLREHCFELADLDGLPFAARDAAGRAALTEALDAEHPARLHEAFARMGFELGERSYAELRRDLLAVRDALRKAELGAGPGESVQLVALGRHDGALAAAISLGDLDQAGTVGVLVPGMRSDVHGLGDAYGAFRSIRGDRPDVAMVSWSGYRAPGLIEEMFQTRADAGGAELAAFLDGLAAMRAADPPDRLVVIGHSYGTNVAAEGLRATRADVDAFVSLGSAGLRYATTADALGVPEVHATHAAGDGIAHGLGQHVHVRPWFDGGGAYEARVDPRELAGAREFTSERTADGAAVTMHNLLVPISWGPEWLGLQRLADGLDGTAAADEIGYLNTRSSTVHELGKIVRDEWR
ncbi:alpha/beta hydrolase family protein [Leucobacter allii]|uniref:Alpha/beta hydrolase family protein n=1 Tax=Leucobacter allii TaxID=2932247 RepID=A0ABY4FJB2_9MICO|nr:alpha/beta hydrolase [Leucobacter allii]UOQ56480.1 alpha/beta hydrolase family protein [Leucobacter allii]